MHLFLEEPTLPSGTLWQNQVSFLIFLRVDLIGLVEDVTLWSDFVFSCPFLLFLLGFSFALAGQSCSLSIPGHLGLLFVFLALVTARLVCISHSSFAASQSDVLLGIM